MLDSLTGYNEGEFLLIGDWSLAAIAVMASLTILLLVLTWIDLLGLRRRRRWTILGLRALALSAALLLLLEPALELRSVTSTPNQAAFLVDTSASMALPIAHDTHSTRAQQQVETWSSWIADPPDDHIPRLYGFDTTLRNITLDTLAETPVGEGTHILESLEALLRETDRRDIGGAVVISDGADNGILGRRTPIDAPLDLDLAERLERLGFPVHTVATGAADELRDISIRAVRHTDFAFVRNAVEIEVDVSILGRFSGDIPATLYRNGEAIQTRRFRADQNNSEVTLRFSFTPETIGREIYAINIPVQPGEAVEENNQAFFLLRVVRDRIRVLHVAGHPGWDSRFLRQLLRGNPNVDLVAFFILRTDMSVHLVPQWESALIQFPTDDIFRTELASFDLVVFQNFTHVPYSIRSYLPGIAQYVRRGGAMVMIGGEQSFSSGGYASTAIADILPVRIAPPTGQSALITTEPFRMELTPAGARHPITRLEQDPRRNREVWENLPKADGSNRTLGAQPWATTLATHPTIQGEDGPMPVIAVGDVGEGRTMALTTDSTWRWTFDSIAQGETGRTYAAFWNSAVRWLIRDPELNLVQIELPQVRTAPGQRLEAQVRFYDVDYSPAADAQVRISLIRRPLDVQRMMEREVVQSEDLRLDASGTHTWSGVLDAPGIYELHASRLGESGSQHEARELVLVLPPLDELRDIRPRPDLLEAISEATGGTHHRMMPPRRQVPPLQPARVVEVDRRTVVDLWNHPAILLLFLILLGTEWWLRRRWGRL